MKKIVQEKEKHGVPGSRAGPRRQWIRERWQQLAEHGTGNELVDLEADSEYGLEDALMEDILGNTAHLTSQPTPEPVYLGHLHRKFFNRVADQMERYREAIDGRSTGGDRELLDVSHHDGLPSDKEVSDVIRAYRDRHGTRNRPIGIVNALQHVLKDLGVPTVAFGEFSYTSLLTCCRTPKEARRIFKLMNDQRHPISVYSWSILVDIHAKLADYEGCNLVIQEMVSSGVPPNQAAYTSLMAACFKVCNDGRIPHSVRAHAGKLGWEKWQEMRIVGIAPDAMCYGAIIRLCASRGQAERAINLLEEMNFFDVKPTTLCFSSALRAVARSHEIGLRYERGSSRKQLRREQFAAHHGNMARQIVIMAEAAEVVQDDGFVSALMLCSAAAGDSATTKATFLASEVRRMDHLRTIGADSDLMRLRGESPMRSAEASSTLLIETSQDKLESDPENPTAHVSTSDAKGRALQLSTAHSIPPFGEREYGKDTRVLSAMLHACSQAVDKNGVGTIWAGKENEGYLCENSLRLITTRWEPSYRDTSIPGVNSTKIGVSSLRRFDEDDRDDQTSNKVRRRFRGLFVEEDDLETPFAHSDDEEDDFGMPDDDSSSFHDVEDDSQQLSDHMGSADTVLRSGEINSEQDLLHNSGEQFECFAADKELDTSSDDDEFERFFHELKTESLENGLEGELTELEARELFSTMQNEFSEMLEAGSVHHGDSDTGSQENQNEFIGKMNQEAPQGAFPVTDGRDESPNNLHVLAIPRREKDDTFLENLDEATVAKVADLREALPGLPLSRVLKIVKAFDESLQSPSILALVPILRERIPDFITPGWLKRQNIRNAEFVMAKVAEEGVYGKIDISMLNSMLQVKAKCAMFDEALQFHAEEFRRQKLTPNSYSDRLIIQMLVSHNRISRAMAFKQRVEKDKRVLDLKAYGTLVDYYARHEQPGSAILLLKECISTHGAPPSENDLSKLRLLYRQIDELDLSSLERMIGADPVEWLRHGETHLKRERSKRGNRGVQVARNRILQA